MNMNRTGLKSLPEGSQVLHVFCIFFLEASWDSATTYTNIEGENWAPEIEFCRSERERERNRK